MTAFKRWINTTNKRRVFLIANDFGLYTTGESAGSPEIRSSYRRWRTKSSTKSSGCCFPRMIATLIRCPQRRSSLDRSSCCVTLLIGNGSTPISSLISITSVVCFHEANRQNKFWWHFWKSLPGSFQHGSNLIAACNQTIPGWRIRKQSNQGQNQFKHFLFFFLLMLSEMPKQDQEEDSCPFMCFGLGFSGDGNISWWRSRFADAL
mgnify:FL=1